MPSLSERFLKLWNDIGAIGSPANIFADLVSRYSEPWRAYHTLAHIEAMFTEFDAFRGSEEAHFVDLSAVEMAVWYHDAVYDTHARDNEEKSATLFRIIAECSFFTSGITERVIKLILATKHSAASSDLDIATLCDIDLAILGQPEATLDEYERQIRKEYEWVPEAQFRAGRAAILESFLKRPTIYATKFFREKYENQARKNLACSIQQLNSN